MRKILAILFFTVAVYCAAQNNLRLFTGTGIPFTVYIGDSAVNKKPEVDVLLQKITKDTITVKIEFTNKLRTTSQIFLLEKGFPAKNKEFKYLVDIKNEKVRLTFMATEVIRPLPSPLVPEKPIIDTSYKINNNLLGHYCELKDGKPTYFNNLPKSGDCVKPMPALYMTYANYLIKKAQTEDDRYLVIENTCMNNCLSVSQLNQMLIHINYEIEKLKLVRFAYFHITDKENSGKLDSTFKLESSKKELQSFIKSSGEYKYSSGHSCAKASPAQDITALGEKLSVYSNDAERFIVFKKLYPDLCYSSEDIRQLLAKFIHDREKLDASKLLYHHCVDKENFLNIADVFSYNTSAAELKQFVEKQK